MSTASCATIPSPASRRSCWRPRDAGWPNGTTAAGSTPAWCADIVQGSQISASEARRPRRHQRGHTHRSTESACSANRFRQFSRHLGSVGQRLLVKIRLIFLLAIASVMMSGCFLKSPVARAERTVSVTDWRRPCSGLLRYGYQFEYHGAPGSIRWLPHLVKLDQGGPQQTRRGKSQGARALPHDLKWKSGFPSRRQRV